MTQRLHVVLGAGAVGQTVTELLHARGERLRLVNRTGIAAPPGVETVRGDIADLDFARDVGEGATHIYNCLNPPYTRWPELWPPLMAGALAVAERNQAKLIIISNLYVYGHTHGEPLRESTPHRPHTVKGRVRDEVDRLAMAAHEAGRHPVALLRASDFFGPRARNALTGAPVLERLARGKVPQFVGDPDQLHTYSYVPDVARALVLLGERDEALGQEWHVPSPPTQTSRAFIHTLCEAAGQRRRLMVMPKVGLRLLSWVSPTMNELREMVYQFEEPYVADDSKFRAAFPDFAETPLDEAVRESVAWFREHASART